MENNGQSIVNPNVTFLTEILENISIGDLRIPNFQRPYVWKPSDAIALFDSIYKGFPIGSVLFWETSEKLISFTKIGPFELNLDERQSTNYVIDGHQRLSTLYGILKSKKSFKLLEPNRWALYFDLDKDEFYFKTATTKVANYIAMDKVINAIDFLDECKRIQYENPSSAENYVNKAQKLTQAIVTYKIAVTQIKKGNLSSAVEIFSRLNTRGMDITPDQMLSALTYKEGMNPFKLADKIDDILSSLVPYDFSEIERVFIFRSIIAASRRDIYSVKLEDIAKDDKIQIPQIVENCELSIIESVKFLKKYLKVPSDKFLPYNLQLVFLNEFFYTKSDPSDEQLLELVKWFWFTSYSGWFAGANSSKIRKGLEDIRKFALNQAKSILPDVEYSAQTVEIPEKFDFRYARIKAFILFLNNLNPQSLDDGNVSFSDILVAHGPKALHNIVPNENNSFANKIIFGPARAGQVKSDLVENKSLLTNTILESHGLTFEAITHLEHNNYQHFLIIRHNKLIELEQEFIESFGLTYKVSARKPRTNRNQFFLFEFED